MTQHLNSNGMAACLLGEGTQEDTRHARECGACGGDLETMERALAGFRRGVRRWSEQAGSAGYQPVWKGPRLFVMSGRVEGRSAREATGAGMSSLLIHAAGVALLFSINASPTIRRVAVESVRLIATDLREYLPRPATARPERGGGGGGGGARQPLPASYGKLPKPAPRQFVPPSATPVQAELIVPPSIAVPAGIPELQASNWGDPLSRGWVPSNGPGCCSGIGGGRGTGVGDGDGSGAGPGRGGGIGGGVYRIGGGVSAPVLMHKVEPEYSEEARKAKFQGTVVLAVVVDASGRPREIRVMQAVGLGLDEKAIDAVRRWRFHPGRRGGKPVAVLATVEVNFRLL